MLSIPVLDREERAAFIRKDIKYDDWSDVMNGNMISFNGNLGIQYRFLFGQIMSMLKLTQPISYFKSWTRIMNARM